VRYYDDKDGENNDYDRRPAAAASSSSYKPSSSSCLSVGATLIKAIPATKLKRIGFQSNFGATRTALCVEGAGGGGAHIEFVEGLIRDQPRREEGECVAASSTTEDGVCQPAAEGSDDDAFFSIFTPQQMPMISLLPDWADSFQNFSYPIENGGQHLKKWESNLTRAVEEGKVQLFGGVIGKHRRDDNNFILPLPLGSEVWISVVYGAFGVKLWDDKESNNPPHHSSRLRPSDSLYLPVPKTANPDSAPYLEIERLGIDERSIVVGVVSLLSDGNKQVKDQKARYRKE
jgi:hypothetical protein